MKCQHCEKPATFHITELTDQMAHKWFTCARSSTYLLVGRKRHRQSPGRYVNKQLKLEQTADQLAKQDKKTCPVLRESPLPSFVKQVAWAAPTTTCFSKPTWSTIAEHSQRQYA